MHPWAHGAHFSWAELILIISMLKVVRPSAADFARAVHCPHFCQSGRYMVIYRWRVYLTVYWWFVSQNIPRVSSTIDLTFPCHVECEDLCNIGCSLEPVVMVSTCVAYVRRSLMQALYALLALAIIHSQSRVCLILGHIDVAA